MKQATAQRTVLLMVRALSIGGCERDLTKMALALDRSKYEPHVACFRPDGPRYPELAAAGVPVLHLPVTSFASWSAVKGAFELGRYIRRHRIQVLHAFDVPTDIFGAPVARAFGVPAVITCQLSFRCAEFYTAAERRLLWVTDLLSDRIVVNSRAVQDDLIARGVPASKLFVSYNGIDAAAFRRCEDAARVPQVAGASIVVGTICALRKEKRLDLLLTAFARLIRPYPETRLLIVGTGEKEGAWRQLSEQLGLGPKCVFVPAQDDVRPWLHSMDVFVSTSESESFPNAVLEAMAAGCCVVGSRVGGLPELITDGQNGLMFDAGDVDMLERALRRVLDGAALRKRLASSAERTASEQFSIEIAARRTEALYSALLDS